MEYIVCADAAEWPSWLAANHATATEVWVHIAKKNAPEPSVTITETLAAHPTARAAYDALGRTDQYRLYLPVLKATTPAERVTRITQVIATLAQ